MPTGPGLWFAPLHQPTPLMAKVNDGGHSSVLVWRSEAFAIRYKGRVAALSAADLKSAYQDYEAIKIPLYKLCQYVLVLHVCC